jgi:hypothetical protein
MRAQELMGPALEPCPICDGDEHAYMWANAGRRLDRCIGCGLVTASGAGPVGNGPNIWTERDWSAVAELTDARRVIGPVLVLARPDDVPASVRARLDDGRAHIVDPDLDADWTAGGPFATVLVVSGLDTCRDPRAFLGRVRSCLAGDGVLLVAYALADSRAARMLGRRWQGWIQPARWHLTRKTLHLLLLRSGFHRVWLRELGRARRLQTPLGRVLASAEVARAHDRLRLSIIVPVFNEASTCATLLDRLVAKTLPGLDKEIVIVESNSTDGTRDIVQRYRDLPGVTLVLEDRPRGKGAAVRTGLTRASGDLVLIQDGDLEYDIDDYEALLEPLVQWQSLFVLGSRHTGHWKMRVFNDAPITAAVFNLGQLFYTALVNLVLRTAMADPFTMFKVFRRDCLFGLALTGRRFDFDFELVMKLVRKGYVPLELPVNYRARSFAEGKKVSFVRDGLTWVWVVAKYGFGPLGAGDQARFGDQGRP